MTSHHPTAVIILAAGEGTRMKSRTPKVLHSIGGRTLLGHAMHAARAASPQHLAVVVRHERDLVAAHIAELDPAALVADQDETKGTGRACECGLDVLPTDLSGTVLVTMGDVPLLTGQTLTELTQRHESSGAAVTVITAELPDAKSYGRVVRDEQGEVVQIMEYKDALAHREAGDHYAHVVDVREINSGIYAFDAAVLRRALQAVTTDNNQGEMYLTDVLSLARNDGGRVAAVSTTDRWQVEGANDRVQLAALGTEHNRRIVEAWMRAGVSVIDPATTWIDSTVQLAQDVTILPGTQLHGQTTVASDAVVGPDSTLTDVQIAAGAEVTRTHGTGAIIGEGAHVGPFTYLRPGTVLGAEGKIGAFYETKNVIIGRGSKLSHLGYAGDAEIGEDTNIGCGNITANFDGVNKHRTTIGSGVRTGSNTVFVAPVSVGDGAFTGAGAIVRKDVPAGALTLTVAPQRNAEGWTAANRPGSVSAQAAEKATENAANAAS